MPELEISWASEEIEELGGRGRTERRARGREGEGASRREGGEATGAGREGARRGG
jgi:hypothetical protein